MHNGGNTSTAGGQQPDSATLLLQRHGKVMPVHLGCAQAQDMPAQSNGGLLAASFTDAQMIWAVQLQWLLSKGVHAVS
jgi:hypothetical protein